MHMSRTFQHRSECGRMQQHSFRLAWTTKKDACHRFALKRIRDTNWRHNTVCCLCCIQEDSVSVFFTRPIASHRHGRIDIHSSVAHTCLVAEWACLNAEMQKIVYHGIGANCQSFAVFCRTGRYAPPGPDIDTSATFVVKQLLVAVQVLPLHIERNLWALWRHTVCVCRDCSRSELYIIGVGCLHTLTYIRDNTTETNMGI